MKQRVITGWNFQRVIYVLLGGAIIVQSVMQHEWGGVILGGYFASMGVFAFGCAAGNCFGNTCSTPAQEQSLQPEEIKPEETKSN
ncbi:MAG: hypothetical protein OJF59_002075 [Cytophagales bacterium]|jgi:hypothetical protein|nr:hypothetical protein [Bacteroidota bacterium]MBS1980963.1 hypothetical protein [Bacteroidota bacterium]WHZ08322.1 MAG: hypothetical protein OJF59_002075 [Cytophagales bacterium]